MKERSQKKPSGRGPTKASRRREPMFSTTAIDPNDGKQDLTKKETYYSNLFDCIPVETVVVDTEGRVVAFNRAKQESGKRLPGIGDRMYKDYAGRHQIDMHAELMDCIRNKKKKHFNSQKYDGRVLCITISPFPHGAIITSQDVTDQEWAKEALKESEAKYRTLFNGVPVGLFRVSPEGQILDANPALIEMLGHQDLSSLQNYRINDFFTKPDDFQRARLIMKGEGVLDDFETVLNRPDGRAIVIRANVRRMPDGKGDTLFYEGAIRDITESKHAEEEKEKMQAQLLHSKKMEAIGTLAGGIAHDFNNFLTAMQVYIDLALQKMDEQDVLFNDLKEVQLAACRAGNLTRQLLVFSRRHATHVVLVQLNHVIDELLRMLQRLIGEDIRIVTDLEPELWMVRVDRSTMEQVIMNLAINARDAMPMGGILAIKTENVHIDELYAKTVQEARPGQFVRLTISDDGQGIDKETIQRIFDPFFSTKGQKGTGLGLAVVYGIVKQDEGWINVYSEPGRGTEFKIYLPAVFAHEDLPVDATIPIEELQGNGEQILVVEDEDCVREFASRALQKNGYSVVNASTAKDAIKAFEKCGYGFDLVFCDVVLPDTSGIELIEKLLMCKPNLRILLSSGYTDTRSQWFFIQEKGFRFLQKPYALIDLLHAVKTELAAGIKA